MNTSYSPDRVEIHLKTWPATKFAGLTLGAGLVFLGLAYAAYSHHITLNYAARYNPNSYKSGDLFTFIINSVPAPVQFLLLLAAGLGLSYVGLLIGVRHITGKPAFEFDNAGIHGGLFRRKHVAWPNLKMVSYHAPNRNSLTGDLGRQTRIYAAPTPGGKAKLEFMISENNYAVDDAAIRAIVKRYRPDLPADAPSPTKAS